MTTEMVEIRTICEFLDNRRVPVEESERKPGLYPYFGATGQLGWIDGYIFDEPLVLLAEDGGPFCSNTEPIAYKITGKTWVNNHAHVLRPNSKCDLDYLCHVLSFYDVRRFISGTTRMKLTKSQAEIIPIPLPLLPEQKRIAGILEKADRLRRLRRYAIKLSETYLQSVFLEMFGDPVMNPKRWETRSLGSCLSFMTSGSRGWAEHYSTSGDIFLRIQNIGRNKLLLDDLTYVQAPNNAESRRTAVRAGDLILSITADLGRTAVIPNYFPTAYINQHLALLRLEGVDPVFVAACIDSPGGKHQIESLDRGGVKSGLNFDDVSGLQITDPPSTLQKQFAQTVRKFERLQSQQREAHRQAEHLFQMLLHKAFNGELN